MVILSQVGDIRKALDRGNFAESTDDEYKTAVDTLFSGEL